MPTENNQHQGIELLTPSAFPLVNAGDNLATLIVDCLRNNTIKVENGDLIVLAQKIVSKAENRFRKLSETKPSEEARRLAKQCDKDARFVELVLQESTSIVRCKPGVIIAEHKQGFISANAGIDHSNVSREDDDTVLLLPEDVNRSAREIRKQLMEMLGMELALLINDSFGRPWRLGSCGVALGSSGLETLVDLRGKTDLFGNELLVTEIAIADEIASAASLVMGQANEGCPLVIIKGLDYRRSEQANCSKLIRPKEQDMFR